MAWYYFYRGIYKKDKLNALIQEYQIGKRFNSISKIIKFNEADEEQA